MEVNHLTCPRLEDNAIFNKLVERTRGFYITAELYKKRGPT